METQRPWHYPTRLCTTGRLEKKSINEQAQCEKVRGKEVVNESQKDEEGKRGVSQDVRATERGKKRESELVTVQRHWLVEASQSQVLGMKTGRAVYRSQAQDSTMPERSSSFLFLSFKSAL